MVTLRVAHVITKGDVGGAQTHVVELVVAQMQAGHEVTIIAGCDGPAMERARASNVAVVIVPSLGRSRTQWHHRTALRDIRAALQAVGPDVVHGHSSTAGLLSRIAARREGYASVYTAHGWPFQRGAPLRQRVLSLAGEAVGGRLGDAVICLTPTEARRARRAIVASKNRIHVVANGIADVTHRARLDGDGPLGLVVVARFAPPKMQRELLAALAPIAHEHWTLSFVGDGPELAAAESAAAHFPAGKIRFLGHCDDVPSVLATHDVSVLWSRYEGMPMATLEAMRAGLVCIANELPGVVALFGDPPAGLVARGDAELRALVRKLIEDRPMAQDLGERARTRYEQAFSVEAMAGDVQRIYELVLAQRRSVDPGDEQDRLTERR